MKKKYAVLLAAVCVGLLCANAQSFAKEQSPAPDFSLKDLKNSSFILSSFTDKQPVLLMFWATWCPFCRSELKSIAGRYDGLLKDGMQFAAVDVGESPARVSSFIEKFNYPFPVLLDQDNKVALAYDILGIPTYVLIDKKGILRDVSHSFPDKEYKKILAE